MDNHNTVGIVILLGIVAVGLLGGFKNTQQPSPVGPNVAVTTQNPGSREEIERQIRDLKLQLAAEQEKENWSVYHGQVHLNYVSRSTDPTKEYVVLKVDSSAVTPIAVTGWKLHSIPSGTTYTIPNGTKLYWNNTVNNEEPIYLIANDTAYIITGTSPNGYSFELNKCSGYLSQFQQYTPYLSTSCPLARDEDLSAIPRTRNNDACFDYIDAYPACKTETQNLPVTWSPQCTNFITTKLTYASCVNTHKTDSNFYLHDWRIYLKRSESVWGTRKEHIVLYDTVGKVVDELTY